MSSDEKVPLLIVGNKHDYPKKSIAEAFVAIDKVMYKYKSAFRLKFCFCSAKTGH